MWGFTWTQKSPITVGETGAVIESDEGSGAQRNGPTPPGQQGGGATVPGKAAGLRRSSSRPGTAASLPSLCRTVISPLPGGYTVRPERRQTSRYAKTRTLGPSPSAK